MDSGRGTAMESVFRFQDIHDDKERIEKLTSADTVTDIHTDTQLRI